MKKKVPHDYSNIKKKRSWKKLVRKGKEKNRIPLFLNLHLIRRLAGKNYEI